MRMFIPPALASHEPEVQRFFDAMIYKLKRNAHKGKWEGVNLEQMRKRLSDELAELDLAIADGNVIEIILEAADVANFALIIADIAIRDAAKKRTSGRAAKARGRKRT